MNVNRLIKPIRTRLLMVLILLLALPAPAQEDVRPIVGRNLIHIVKPQETMYTIARKYGLAVDHLAFANGFSPTAIILDPGVKLVIPGERILPKNPPTNGLVLNLPERGVYLFRNGHFDRFVPVSIGDEDGFRTPTGQYSIIEKITNPTWYPPVWAKDRTPVGPGPNNPLGAHWIGLSLPRTGIHGTNQPLNVGNSVTHGCIRAYPDVVAKLYNDVKVGWPVRIEYETVKFGRSGHGPLKVVTFPDVYKKQSPQSILTKVLGEIPRSLEPLVNLDLGVTMEVDRHRTLYREISERTR